MKIVSIWVRLTALSGAVLACAACSNNASPPLTATDPAAVNGNDQPASNSDDSSPVNEYQLSAQEEPFGQTADGQAITRYLLTNRNGLKVSLIDFGATVTSVEVPDRDGNIENITLGFQTLAEYEANAPYFGSLCGRYAGRIAGGKFTLDDVGHTLATNNGPNHLHGGVNGFHKVVWKAESWTAEDSVGVRLTYVSPDGEEGYPGTLTANVEYRLSNRNELTIDYTAHADKATPLNLTNHCYWNLAGAGTGRVLDQELTLHCARYLPVDETLIPTGELKDVADSPMDFTTPHTIGSRIEQVPGGYDHCYVIDGGGKELKLAARVREPKSGRVMEIRTTEPGVQLYTGNFLDGSPATGGFDKHAGVCLECQHFPDSPNQPQFPDTILRPRHVYKQTTVHRFLVER